MTIRVLIADDQPVVRDGLAVLLSLLDDVEIVATAADGIEAVERARSERPDIVLMDLRMPRLEGAAANNPAAAGRSGACSATEPAPKAGSVTSNAATAWTDPA